MCKVEGCIDRENYSYKEAWKENIRLLGDGKAEKFKKSVVWSFRMRLWVSMTIILACTCAVQLMGFREIRRPGLLKSWPCRSNQSYLYSAVVELYPLQANIGLPPKRVYANNGYLMVSCNGGLNQMRAAICDMVTVATSLNATLIVPELDKASFWKDPSEFHDVFDVDHFINSLRDKVQILKELPPQLKTRAQSGKLHSLPPISWSNISYYHKRILPLLKKHKVVHLVKTDARLANNAPLKIQKLRCRVNYEALRFNPRIEETGRRVVSILHKKGPFVVLHLRYEMDMLAFTGCSHGCDNSETEELARLRWANTQWKDKEINSERKRKEGLCPLTPEETALVLKALGIDRNIQIYVAAGEIYGGQDRMSSLKASFPNLVSKETLLEESDLMYFRNRSNQMAALDYQVALASDTFIPTYDGNMAKVVEGHRRFLGFKKTISLNRKLIVELIDQYEAGSISWDEFSTAVKYSHTDRIGNRIERKVVPGKPKEEDYFYANPHECLDFVAQITTDS